MKHLLSCLAVVATIILVSCISSPSLVMDPIGPAGPSSDRNSSGGSLMVYTATKRHNDGYIIYYPHTGYTIYSDKTTVYKRVPNAITQEDEIPTVVSLPPGCYLIQAEANHYAAVQVPVVIKSGQMTVVDLDGDVKWESSRYNESDLVRLPNGSIAGIRAHPKQ